MNQFTDKIIFKRGEVRLSCLHKVKRFHLLQFITNDSICAQLNGFKYYCLTLVHRFIKSLYRI